MPTTLPATGAVVATDDIAGVAHQLMKVEFGAAGAATPVSAANPLPVTTGFTQALTDAQLRATAVPVSGAVSVSNFASLAGLPVTGTFYQATQAVSIASMPTTPVTFTWAGLTDTQLRATAVPVSFTWAGLTDAQLRATPVPVSGTVAVTGTFWQATQPVSGSVSVSNFPATQPVSGTFWQATQPVSIAGTVTTNTGLTQPLTDTQLRAAVVPVSISNFPATQNTDVSDRAARLLGVVASITNALPAGTNKLGTVDIATAPAVAKGTQGANALPTQDLKDSGRVAISFTAEFSPAAVAETMLTMTISKDGATPTTGSSYVITSGKRLRLASKSIAVENTLGTSIQRAYLRTRVAATGGALVASPLQANVVAAAAGTVKSIGTNFDDYPDGMEFLGDGTRAIGWSLQAPDWVTASATLKVYVTVIAFEY